MRRGVIFSGRSSRLRALVGVAVSALVFVAGTISAHAVTPRVTLHVTCSASTGSSSWSATMRNSASGGGTSTVRTSGGKVFVGGQVTCRIVESDPDAYVVTHTANLTRAAGTGAFPRTDAYTATAAGNAEIVYTLQGPGGKPKITLTLRFKVVPAPPP